MINIAEFIGSTGSGGAETVVKDYALHLDRSKYNVVVIVRNREPQSPNDILLTDSGVRIIPIYKHSNSRLFFKGLQKLNDWWYIPVRLKKILKEEQVEVLHIHLELLRYVARIRNDIKNSKLYFTCHSRPDYIFTRYKREYKAAKCLIKENNLQMIALNNEQCRRLNELFHIDSTVVLRNGVDVARYKLDNLTKEEIRKKVQIPEDAFVVGHVGRFSEVKNHRFLIEVFQAVTKKRDNAFLLMVGAVSNITKEIETKLNEYGLGENYLILQNRTDIPELLKTMDVFVFPSYFEGLAIALIEAQIAGLRCIVSDQVPKESFISELTVPLSLQQGVSEWCNAVLDAGRRGSPVCSIDDYRLSTVIKQLEAIYCGDYSENRNEEIH